MVLCCSVGSRSFTVIARATKAEALGILDKHHLLMPTYSYSCCAALLRGFRAALFWVDGRSWNSIFLVAVNCRPTRAQCCAMYLTSQYPRSQLRHSWRASCSMPPPRKQSAPRSVRASTQAAGDAAVSGDSSRSICNTRAGRLFRLSQRGRRRRSGLLFTRQRHLQGPATPAH